MISSLAVFPKQSLITLPLSYSATPTVAFLLLLRASNSFLLCTCYSPLLTAPPQSLISLSLRGERSSQIHSPKIVGFIILYLLTLFYFTFLHSNYCHLVSVSLSLLEYELHESKSLAV